MTGSTVSGISAAACVIAANRSGNANVNPAPQVTQSIVVGPGSQTILFGTAPVVAVGGTGAISATASSGLAVSFTSTTPAICSVAGSTVSGLAAGTCTIAANQGGNANFGTAPQVTQTLTVAPGPQTITFGAAPSLTVGGTGAVTAASSSGLAVAFTSTTPTVCSVTGSTVSGIAAGSCVIAGNQAGNANYSAAPQVTQTIAIGAASQTIIFGAAPAVAVGGTGTVSATASSGLAVTFTSTTPTVCSVAGSTVSGLAAGSCAIAGNQSGNANYSAAPQATQTFTISAAGSVGLSPGSLVFGNQLVGSVSVSQAVTLTNGGTAALAVGTITASANFRVGTTTCGSTLRAGQSCSIAVLFAPTSTGALPGTLAVGTIGSVALTGTGVAPGAAISPATYVFASQQIAVTSPVQVFTYSNTGSVLLAVSTVSLAGTNSANFNIASDGCTGVSLAPGASCNIGIAFTPSAAGSRVATLRVRDAAGGAGTVSASLSGTGVVASATLTDRSVSPGSKLARLRHCRSIRISMPAWDPSR